MIDPPLVNPPLVPLSTFSSASIFNRFSRLAITLLIRILSFLISFAQNMIIPVLKNMLDNLETTSAALILRLLILGFADISHR